MDHLHFKFPLENPVLIFSLVLFIILFAPIILSRLRIPPIIGLIIAGAVIGPHGLNIMLRDSSIVLFGTVGLLYIMFLAGLEIDMADFKKNKYKSILFGLLTFSIPMLLGTLSSYYILEYSMLSSILLASMLASHTLIAYPIVSRFGVIKNRAVNITVGGTMITDTLSLLVLAVIVGMVKGNVGQEFWITLATSLTIFGIIVLLIIPRIARWFFKQEQDAISEYIFVLGIVFLSAFLAELAGVEAIIGAFLAGLALNKLIPHTSALMNRIEFVGNALFIPFFLIGVGMLINFKVFVGGNGALIIAGIITVVVTLSKFLAAYLTKLSLRFNRHELMMMFGLSNAQAAATLATVLVGYNIIVGTAADGTPIRLLSEDVLNGSIIMILVTCTVSSFVVNRAARKIAILEKEEDGPDETEEKSSHRFLLPVFNEETIESIVNFSSLLKPKKTSTSFFALHVRKTEQDANNGKKLLEKVQKAGASIDTLITPLTRQHTNVAQGVMSSIKENAITDVFLGLDAEHNFTSSYYENTIHSIVAKTENAVYIYQSVQPISTVKRIVVVLPEKVEYEIGFLKYIEQLLLISKELNAQLSFYTHSTTIVTVQKVIQGLNHNLPVSYETLEEWEDLLIISKDIKKDDLLFIVSARKNTLSYHKLFDKLPKQLSKYFDKNNIVLLFPEQYNEIEVERRRMDGSIDDLIEENLKRIDSIGKYFKKIIIGKK